MKEIFVSHSYDETLSIAQKLSKDFQGGDIVLLDGDLGAGKTAFSKGVAMGLDIDDPITSPSFSIMNYYPASPISLCHCDFYRIDTEDDYYNLGLEEYFTENNLLLLEWGEKFAPLISKPYFKIEIKVIDENKRKIEIEKII